MKPTRKPPSPAINLKSKIQNLKFLLAAALFAAPAARAATASGSATADLDFRDYTLAVASAHGGNPVPGIGTHSGYCWRSTVTASVDAVASDGGTNYACTGWTGTGAVPASGSATTTGDWTPVPGATTYRVYRRSREELWAPLAEVDGALGQCVDQGIRPGMAYAYRIAAVNAQGEQHGDPVSVTMPSLYRLWAGERLGDRAADPRADNDGDGVSNHAEFLMDSDPDQAEKGLLRAGFADPYGLGQTYLTLSFRLREDVTSESIRVETTENLSEGPWSLAPEVGNVPEGSLRRVTFRSDRSRADAPRQFLRLITLGDE